VQAGVQAEFSLIIPEELTIIPEELTIIPEELTIIPEELSPVLTILPELPRRIPAYENIHA
jgi:hypothetical protein